ncbi:Mannose-specific lectin [Tetrabaena socialis]|uniref:Mannose-specific lectin n=1 Tax=Tetrabaena socialis TaxID=47790 RepID=A0A2J7ZP83_9CHLO|nr:Mannose-specific lectin [Tetrabaena socialis]PNH02079.1 Mannose-specific lectin [Tetrabaena socialis]|eukprot:PNH02077.1 Mannose-specific lectin [Tetrabaena socialis]
MSCLWNAEGVLVCSHLEDLEDVKHVEELEEFAGIGDSLKSSAKDNYYLYPDQSIFSQNGKYMLTYQRDGNLVLYPRAVWATGPTVPDPGMAVMQDDGNFVLYRKNMTTPYYSTNQQGANPGGQPPYRMVLQGDRNLVIYDANNNVKWAANSQQ